jgi:hypothetical protein
MRSNQTARKSIAGPYRSKLLARKSTGGRAPRKMIVKRVDQVIDISSDESLDMGVVKTVQVPIEAIPVPIEPVRPNAVSIEPIPIPIKVQSKEISIPPKPKMIKIEPSKHKFQVCGGLECKGSDTFDTVEIQFKPLPKSHQNPSLTCDSLLFKLKKDVWIPVSVDLLILEFSELCSCFAQVKTRVRDASTFRDVTSIQKFTCNRVMKILNG